ncbi:unnamed protein product, partial [Staurois parvus]
NEENSKKSFLCFYFKIYQTGDFSPSLICIDEVALIGSTDGH